ncbi:MAG TPA: FAD-dependent oxidoreductase [Acidimicrobiales bacterium]|nr:FAD-dependent oxidoreductase [Acidimicrobiales bacterium]
MTVVSAAHHVPTEAEVVVYGATGAGVTAAVAAARAGADTVLLEPGSHIGGMVSGGLGWTDVGHSSAIGGVTREFYQRVADHYGVPLWELRGPEPHIAEALLRQLLEEAGVRVELGQRLRRVSLTDARITGINTGERGIHAATYVDASYEGDLLAAAGARYRVGREPRWLHRERWAGSQPATRPSRHNFDVLLSPFSTDDGALLPLIRPPALDGGGWPEDIPGRGDGAVQAYAFRLCLTDDPAKRRPFPPPDAYDPCRYELLARYLAAKGDSITAGSLMVLVPDLLPGNKTDANSIGPVSLNLLDGSNWDYPEADVEERAAIRRHHLHYTQGLLYFLVTDPGVPRHISTEMRRWGLCVDEFVDTGGWPHQLYVREGRRLVGEHVLTESDVAGGAMPGDVVAVGSYNIDIREVQRTWQYLPEFSRTAAVFNEGYLSVAVPAYGVPYRSLLPLREECDNLLVPVCLSASHVAFSSVRMEPTWMCLGHAAGEAAALAAVHAGTPHDVPVPALQQRLIDAGQVLSL